MSQARSWRAVPIQVAMAQNDRFIPNILHSPMATVICMAQQFEERDIQKELERQETRWSTSNMPTRNKLLKSLLCHLLQVGLLNLQLLDQVHYIKLRYPLIQVQLIFDVHPLLHLLLLPVLLLQIPLPPLPLPFLHMPTHHPFLPDFQEHKITLCLHDPHPALLALICPEPGQPEIKKGKSLQ